MGQGTVVSFPSGVREGAPTANAFLAYSRVWQKVKCNILCPTFSFSTPWEPQFFGHHGGGSTYSVTWLNLPPFPPNRPRLPQVNRTLSVKSNLASSHSEAFSCVLYFLDSAALLPAADPSCIAVSWMLYTATSARLHDAERATAGTSTQKHGNTISGDTRHLPTPNRTVAVCIDRTCIRSSN